MKNPFLSLWLSYANAWASAMRGFWGAEATRWQRDMMNAWMRSVTMVPGPQAPPPQRDRRRRG